MIGPSSGPPGGATILFRQLLTELRAQSDVAVQVVDTSASTSMVSCVWSLLSISSRIIASVWRSDVVSLHVSSMRAALYAVLIWALCLATGRPWVLRLFGDASVKHSKMRAGERRLLDWMLRRCPLLLVETRIAERYFRSRGCRVEWYSNSRPLARVNRPQSAYGVRRFIFVGHVKPSKGVRDIFVAAEILGNSASVDVYGPLQDGIEAGEFVGNVRYCGKIAADHVAHTLSQYDALLLPTHYSGEGYPGVILEAFAAGMPVIATRWQAIPEIVTDENGILVEPCNPLQLAAAMQYVIRFPAELQNLREGALRAARRFESELWTRRFLELVASLTAQSHDEHSLATASSAKWN